MSIFHFKQFSVRQEISAMKIGTDSTLLGAWADLTNANRILDIGSGTGVLSLMAAQRNSIAKITAVELDDSAFNEAKFNFENSPWSDRLEICHSAIQDFRTSEEFDVILSNPPFYDHEKHLQALELQRRNARSTDTLSFCELCESLKRLISQEGNIYLILPIAAAEDFIKTANENSLFLFKKTMIIPRVTKAANRVMMAFSKTKKPYSETSITIRNAGNGYHDYSPEFIELLKDFLIIF